MNTIVVGLNDVLLNAKEKLQALKESINGDNAREEDWERETVTFILELIDKDVSPHVNKQLKDLKASVLADCYMGKKWEIETIDAIMQSI